MASLQDRLKIGSQLSQTSEEEMQTLAQKAGRPVVPTTPLEGSVIGGNKDQAKMMGSRASKTASLGSTPDSLETKLRRQQVRSQATAEEQQAQQGAQTFGKLSSLDSRVQQIAQGLVNQAGQGTQFEGLSLSEAAQELDPESQQLLRDLESADPNSPAAMHAINELNKKLGRTQENYLSQEELKEYFNRNPGALGELAASGTQDNILVSDLDLPSLGFQDNTELSALLGLAPEELDGLNIADLQQKITAKLNDEYSKVSSLEETANSLNVSPAERAQARKELRAIGAVGVRSTESDMDKLADDIAEAKTVEYDGQEVSIEELLSDEMLSGLAAKYLDEESLDPEFKQRFKEANPDFAAWLDENKAALGDAVSQLDDNVKEYAAIQDYNKSLKNIPATGESLSDNAAEALIPGYNELQADKINPASSAALEVLQGNNPSQAKAVKDGLELLVEVDPSMGRELAQLDRAGLLKLGILNNTDSWQYLTKYLNDVKAVSEIPEGDYQTFFTKFMGTGDEATIKSTLQDLVSRSKSGLFSEENPMGKYFAGMVSNNGQLLPLDQIASNIRTTLKKESLSDLINRPQSDFMSLSDSLAKAKNYQNIGNDIYSRYKDAFVNDGYVDIDEFRKMGSFDKADIEGLMDSKARITPELKNYLVKNYASYTTKDMDTSLQNWGLPSPVAAKRLGPTESPQDRTVNIAAGIQALQSQLKSLSGWKKEAAQKALDDKKAAYVRQVFPTRGSKRNFPTEEEVEMLGRDFFNSSPTLRQYIKDNDSKNWGRVVRGKPTSVVNYHNMWKNKVSQKLKDLGV